MNENNDAQDVRARPWMDFALCAETDPEAFFPESGDSAGDARKVCAACPVRAECLEHALANDERFGIWGGLSPAERSNERRRRAGKTLAARRLAKILAAGEKPCTRCREVKPLAAFSRTGRRGSFASWCRRCVNEYRKAAA